MLLYRQVSVLEDASDRARQPAACRFIPAEAGGNFSPEAQYHRSRETARNSGASRALWREDMWNWPSAYASLSRAKFRPCPARRYQIFRSAEASALRRVHQRAARPSSQSSLSARRRRRRGDGYSVVAAVAGISPSPAPYSRVNEMARAAKTGVSWRNRCAARAKPIFMPWRHRVARRSARTEIFSSEIE